ncbi:transposase [Streptomyces sp. NPDC001678]|uniref:transposase n=1 Tax=Streptomyces sp. NPDC001678 TaxID=3364599 RepID=UPI0036CDC804
MTDATLMALSMLAQRIEQLTGQVDELNQRLTGLVERHVPQLLAPVGIGPDSAVTLLIAMGDNPERLSTEASFAALCGVRPYRVPLGLPELAPAQPWWRPVGERLPAPR